MRILHLTILFKRKPSLTFEEFEEYWTTKHATTFLSSPAAKKYVLKYTQTYISPSLTAKFISVRGGNTSLEESAFKPSDATQPQEEGEYDGIAHLYTRNMEDLVAMFVDEEFQKTVVPDEGNFVDADNVKCFVGWDVDLWDAEAESKGAGK